MSSSDHPSEPVFPSSFSACPAANSLRLSPPLVSSFSHFKISLSRQGGRVARARRVGSRHGTIRVVYIKAWRVQKKCYASCTWGDGKPQRI